MIDQICFTSNHIKTFAMFGYVSFKRNLRIKAMIVYKPSSGVSGRAFSLNYWNRQSR